MTEEDSYLGFSVFPGIGAGRFQSLLSYFITPQNAYSASENELAEVVGKKIASDFVEFRKQFDVDAYKKKLKEKQVSFVTLSDPPYPQKLKDLEKPPFILYYKGDIFCLSPASPAGRLSKADSRNLSTSQSVDGFAQGKRKSIGIVGTRKVTTYGRQVTQSFTRDLIEAGLVVVSGLALGVDAIAHQTTIESEGKTIAVLGCGVDCCYPSANQKLYDQILENGSLIVSEYPLSANPNKGSFPARNRIIAALSDGLLVTEGARDSGSLITADVALNLGRKVFAIPGPVTSSLSRGPLTLIRKGAKLVTSGEEIRKEFQMSNVTYPLSNKKEIRGETEEEQKVIDCLVNENLTFDDLVRKTKLETHVLGTVLSLMEMKGLVSVQNNMFILTAM